jgi:hypothetical protein
VDLHEVTVCHSSSWTAGFRFPDRDTFFATASRPALRPTKLLVRWVPEALCPKVKRPAREAGHSPPSSAEIKNTSRRGA